MMMDAERQRRRDLRAVEAFGRCDASDIALISRDVVRKLPRDRLAKHDLGRLER